MVSAGWVFLCAEAAIAKDKQNSVTENAGNTTAASCRTTSRESEGTFTTERSESKKVGGVLIKAATIQFCRDCANGAAWSSGIETVAGCMR